MPFDRDDFQVRLLELTDVVDELVKAEYQGSNQEKRGADGPNRGTRQRCDATPVT